MSYRIIRMYRDHVGRRTTKPSLTGLTLEEAQAHCRDPETSSSTCTRPRNVNHTKRHGPWFDGYEEE